MLDLDELAGFIASIINEHVSKALEPLQAKIAELEGRAPQQGPPGEKGEPGEKGADGADGRDGNSVSVDDVAPLIVAQVAKAFADVPAPKDGADGKDGRDGTDGKDGTNGLDATNFMVDREGNLIATLSNGETRDLGPVVGQDGKDGKRGRDGFDLTSFDAVVLDDDRTVEFKFISGVHEHVVAMKWPTAIYRGVFSDGAEYDRGDMVTWAGSLWHCDEPTKDKPGTDAWTLAAKKGRDGKDAK